MSGEEVDWHALEMSHMDIMELEDLRHELCRLRELVGEMAGYLEEALQPGSFNERDIGAIRRLVALARKSGGGGQGPY